MFVEYQIPHWKTRTWYSRFFLPLKLANLKVNGLTKMGGQFGQPFEVEKILGLKSSKKDTQKGFFIEAGAAGK